MPARLSAPMAKFMTAVSEETFQVLVGEAKARGISVQELLRAVIIPDWIREIRMSNLIPTSPITTPRAYASNPDRRNPF